VGREELLVERYPYTTFRGQVGFRANQIIEQGIGFDSRRFKYTQEPPSCAASDLLRNLGHKIFGRLAGSFAKRLSCFFGKPTPLGRPRLYVIPVHGRVKRSRVAGPHLSFQSPCELLRFSLDRSCTRMGREPLLGRLAVLRQCFRSDLGARLEKGGSSQDGCCTPASANTGSGAAIAPRFPTWDCQTAPSTHGREHLV